MGKKPREEGGEAQRPSQDGAGAPCGRRTGGDRQREAAARLERFAHTPGRGVSSRAGRPGGPPDPEVLLEPAAPSEEGGSADGGPQHGGASSPPPLPTHGALLMTGSDLGEDQPSLKEVLLAVQSCNSSLTASLNSLASQVGSIQEGLSFLRHDVQKIRERTAALEGRVGEVDDDIQHLKTDLGANIRKTDAMYTRVEDLENRLRRNNLRLVGVPEKEEGANPTEFTENWLSSKFQGMGLSPLFAIERAHRVPMRPLPPGHPPRAILARVLNCRDRDTILRRARDLPDLTVNGARVSIFPDFSSEVQKRRMRFLDVKKRLRSLGLPYAMMYPAKLRVVVEGEALFFETVAGAVAWLDANERRLRPRGDRHLPH